MINGRNLFTTRHNPQPRHSQSHLSCLPPTLSPVLCSVRERYSRSDPPDPTASSPKFSLRRRWLRFPNSSAFFNVRERAIIGEPFGVGGINFVPHLARINQFQS